ncbi:MAG: serine/threonine protein kinase [Gammaproteobacteria bacterium]|nr:serine/threonine protein kinase [Gammaproteobacteria bacterium]MBU1655043.1 serine/threonine protein kinase [Gammaproteobacteria bacterium]MBU1961540.1 serine/threonine protein kinase [Gammaproteobacteria bacterium]
MKRYSHKLPINEVIGRRYRVQDVLGESGYGATYQAWDERLERPVVVKEYFPVEMAVRDSETGKVAPLPGREKDFLYGLKKYLDEAKVLAKFKHPSIVGVHDFFAENGSAYIVIEHEEGKTLAKRLDEHAGPLPEVEIIEIFVPLLQGLREVHKAGLLHRDIQPDNIFLRDAGDALLINFSAARQALGEHSKSLSVFVNQGYAPPEQYSSRGKQGPYTDLYALGAVLYRAITGQMPVDSVERGQELMEGNPDPLSPAVEAGKGRAAPWLLKLIDSMLALKVAQRPQSCDDVLRIIMKNRLDMGGMMLPESEEKVDATTRILQEEEHFTAEEAPSGGGREGLVLKFLVVIAVLLALFWLWKAFS